MDKQISVSILSADLLHLEDEVHKIEQSGADMLHFDVMDGMFVPNISFGFPVLKAISGMTDLYMDVHLMIQNPTLYIRDFVKSGADMITFHIESGMSPFDTINTIHHYGCKAGLSIKPRTPAKAILPFLDEIDCILVMSVEPGFGGQSYLPEATEKIKEVRSLIGERNILIEVDGGINAGTAPLAAGAGADILVAGSYLFSQPDMGTAIAGLKQVTGIEVQK